MAGASGNVKAGRAFVEIMLDRTKLERGLKAAQKTLRNFSTSLTSVGKGMVTAASVAAAPFAFATKTFAGFDDEMRMVKAVTGSTESEFKTLTEVAEKLGRETSFTAKQVAEGMTAMGRMGFSAKEIEAAIPAVLDLSRATGTDLNEAAEIAANNMRVFGIETSKMSGVADLLTATANGSAQTLTDLAEGLKMAGPQAAAAKDNIINVSGALGVLANMGIRGSLAGTALRKSYSQFAKTDVQKKLQAIGIATVDANGNLRAMPDIMAEIGRAMESMPTAERLGFAEEIFDLRGSLAGLQLGGNIDQMNAFIEKLKTVDDTAAKTAKEMDAGIGGAVRIFLSAIEGIQIAVGRIIGEALTPYINKISLVLNKVAEWAAAHKGLILTIVKGIAGIAALGAGMIAAGVAVKGIALAIGGLSTVFTILKVAVLAPIAAVQGLIATFGFLKTTMLAVKTASLTMWAAVTSPAALVGAVLAGVVAVVWNLTGAWDICVEGAKGLAADFGTAFKSIGEIVGETWDVIKTALTSGDLAGAAKVGLAALKVAWLTGILPLKKAWLTLKNYLADGWTVTVYSILKAGNNLWYGLLRGLKTIGNAIANAWDTIWNGIVGAFETTVAEFKKEWVRFKGVFDSDEKVEAEVARIDQEAATKKTARQQTQTEKEQNREAELTGLEREQESKNSAIDTAMNAELVENERAYGNALAGAAAEIESAKAEWQDALDAVQKQTEEKAAEIEVVEQKVEEATAGTENAVRSTAVAGGDKTAGSWKVEDLNALLGASSLQERAAKAAEESVKQQRETNKHLKKLENAGSLVYGE